MNEFLKKDKRSCAVNYDDLKWISLNNSLFANNLQFRSDKIWMLIKISKEQFAKLSQILPKIDALKEKLEISG